jgi:hypothetical protein
MARAFLENLPEGEIDEKNTFKTYSFANPMVGNLAFKTEYDERFTRTNTSYSIHNREDPIPGLPISYRNQGFMTAEEVSGILFEGQGFDLKGALMGLIMNKFEDNISSYLLKTSHNLEQRISKNLGAVVMPPYKEDVNYSHVGFIVELYEFEYPLILRDSTILQNDSLMAVYGRDENGHFYNQRLYKSSPTFYQHKPYNYYVEVLKTYFPDEFEALEPKYLEENL